MGVTAAEPLAPEIINPGTVPAPVQPHPPAPTVRVAPGRQPRRPRAVPEGARPLISAPGSVQRTAIPGRSAQDIARRLHTMSGDELVSTFAGMPLEQRTEIANLYFGARVRGPDAVRALATQVAARGDNYAQQTILADVLAPQNRDGRISDGTAVHLDLRGMSLLNIFSVGAMSGGNAATILERASRRQLEEIDADLQSRFHETLRGRIDAVSDQRDRAYLHFLTDTTNREQDSGMLRPGARNAWLFRNASGGWTFGERLERGLNSAFSFITPDQAGADSFGTLLQLNRTEATAMRAAHRRTSGGLRMPEPGEAVTNLRDARLQLAGQGLVLDSRDANDPAARRATSDRIARYVALTVMHGKELNGATPAEVDQALAMIRPNLRTGDAAEGRPTYDEVVQAYRSMARAQSGKPDAPWRGLADADRTEWRQHVAGVLGQVAPSEMRGDVADIVAGNGADSPSARARAATRALRGNRVVGGAYLNDLYRALDLRNVPEARRERYAQDMREAFRVANETTLEAAVRRSANAEVTLPNGTRIPSRAMAMLGGNGVLSDTQRIIYALHDSGPARLGEPRLDEIAQIASELSPFDRLVMRERYRAETGGDILAHLGRITDPRARIAENAMLVSPHEHADVMRQMALLTMPLSAESLPRGVSLAAAQAARETYWKTVIPDEAQRRTFLARFQGPNAAEAITTFATQGVDSGERWAQSLDRLRRSAAGTAFTRAVQDIMSDSRVVGDAQMAELVNRLRTSNAHWTAADIAKVDPQRLRNLIGIIRDRARVQTADVDRLSEQTVATLTLVALGVGGVTASAMSAGAATPLVMAGFTMAARLAARAATDRLDGHVGREMILGALPGLFTGIGVAGVFGDSFIGVVASGGTAYAGIRSPGRYMEQDWGDPARALERMARRTGTDFVWGAATTAALYGFIKAITPSKQQQQPQQHDRPTRPDQPDRPVTPNPSEPVPPVAPRPGTTHPAPPAPALPATRPGGPTHTQTGTTALPADRVGSRVIPAEPQRVPVSTGRDLPFPTLPQRGTHDVGGAVTGSRTGTR